MFKIFLPRFYVLFRSLSVLFSKKEKIMFEIFLPRFYVLFRSFSVLFIKFWHLRHL